MQRLLRGAYGVEALFGKSHRFRWQRAAGWVLALLLLVWRATCRYRVIDDPRPALRRAGRSYVYALLHAHQAAAVFVNDEERLAAMVSRSADGDVLAPSLRVRRVKAVRGSTRSGRRDKGGRRALADLSALLASGVPALIAVDGPRGPRNHVHAGVADLARRARVPVLPTLVLPSRRFLLKRSWDRFQIPAPFSEVRLIFGEPLEIPETTSLEEGRRRIREALLALERRHDPEEAGRAKEAAAP